MVSGTHCGQGLGWLVRGDLRHVFVHLYTNSIQSCHGPSIIVKQRNSRNLISTMIVALLLDQCYFNLIMLLEGTLLWWTLFDWTHALLLALISLSLWLSTHHDDRWYRLCCVFSHRCWLPHSNVVTSLKCAHQRRRYGPRHSDWRRRCRDCGWRRHGTNPTRYLMMDDLVSTTD